MTKIKVEVEITKQQIDDIIDAAMQGCTHWCDAVRIIGKTPKGAVFASEVISRGGRLNFHDAEEGWKVLTLKKFLKGISLTQNTKFDDYDMLDADAAVQCALFGEITYS